MTLRAVLEESAATGCRSKCMGAGMARSQDPPPGTYSSPGSGSGFNLRGKMTRSARRDDLGWGLERRQTARRACAGTWPSCEVAGLEYDSRRVGKDFLFFAFARIPRRRTPVRAGRDGPRCVRGGQRTAARPADFVAVAAWIEVEHGRQALAIAARNFYQQPG